MTTYAAMQARIADEIARTDLTNQIKTAILDAIKHHERKRFYWNEAISTFSTVVGQEWYGSAAASWIPNVVKFDSLRVTINNGLFPLNLRSMQEIEEISSGVTTTGEPSDYCYYRQQVRLYPVPNGVRTLTAAYIQRFAALSGDTDTNAWMTDGEALIRTRAKIILWEEIIRGNGGKQEGQYLRTVEGDILQMLRGETAGRSRNTIVAYTF